MHENFFQEFYSVCVHVYTVHECMLDSNNYSIYECGIFKNILSSYCFSLVFDFFFFFFFFFLNNEIDSTSYENTSF